MSRISWRYSAAIFVCGLISLPWIPFSSTVENTPERTTEEAVATVPDRNDRPLADTMLYPGTPIPEGFYLVQDPSWRWPNPGGTNPPKGTPVTITYSLAGLTDLGLTCSQTRSAVQEAMGLWARYAPLHFVEMPDAGACPTSSDGQYSATGTPNLRFGTHGFDGTFGVLAHTYFPSTASGGLSGDLHFDCGEVWDVAPGSGSTIDFLEVCVHELGHALGLGHEQNLDAIMNPYYAGRYSGLGSAFLVQDDINGIRAIYGNGTGSVLPLSGAGCGDCTTTCDPGGGGGCAMENLVSDAFSLPGFNAFPEIEHLLVPPTSTPVPKGKGKLLPIPDTQRGRRQSLLESLRHFRDSALAGSQEGRELIRLYYHQSEAVSEILSRHPKLAIDSLVLMARCVPNLDAAARSPEGTLRLSADHFEQGLRIIADLRRHASSELDRDLNRLERFLMERRKFRPGDEVELQLKDAPLAVLPQPTPALH